MLHTRRWIKAITGALVLCLLGSVMSVHGQAQGVREGVVRLHVLANSDSTTDQTVKLQVRDAVSFNQKSSVYNNADQRIRKEAQPCKPCYRHVQ